MKGSVVNVFKCVWGREVKEGNVLSDLQTPPTGIRPALLQMSKLSVTQQEVR